MARRSQNPLVLSLEALTADRPSTTTFLRGLAAGALVGAAIAGSTLWERRRLRAGRRAVAGRGEAGPPAPE